MPNLVVLDQKTRALANRAMVRHRTALQPVAGWNHKVVPGDTLIPADECRAVVAGISHDLEPAGDTERTASWIEVLTGSLPFTKESADGLENADMWLAAIRGIYAENPTNPHERAIIEILKRCEYRPKVFDVHKVFEEFRGAWMIAKHTAEKHLKEHERRQTEAERQAKPC